ncbi:MAG: hypothetical protein ABI967_15920, partial [bacterium]
MSTKFRLVFCMGMLGGVALIAALALATWALSSHAAAGSVPRNNSVTNAVPFTLTTPDFAPSSNNLVQEVLTGEWTASVEKDDAGRIQLNLERRGEKGGTHQTGQSYDFTDLQGLSREQALSGGAVKFSLVREAGRIDCEGTFQN